MAESGARCGEVSTVLLKDISWNDHGFILTIRNKRSKSKFGRRIPLCACAEDVKSYINNFHPFKNSPEAPLFVSFADRITPKSNLKVGGIEGIVKKVAQRAGVDKRINIHPHIFRHARASQLAELGWNEPMLRQFFGWSKSSKMPATYIHMSQAAMNNRYYQMYGKAKPEDDRAQNLEEPQLRSECGKQNPTGYRFCFHCNTVLDRKRRQFVDNQKVTKNALNLIAKDNKLAEKFSQLLEEAMVKHKNRDALSAISMNQAEEKKCMA